jgi:3-oxoacyl-[acyl-carrier protein] reductase
VVEAVRKLGAKSIAAPADVLRGTAVKETIKIIGETWGKIDILVNNAGILRNKLLLRTTEEDWDSVMDTNLRGGGLFMY